MMLNNLIKNRPRFTRHFYACCALLVLASCTTFKQSEYATFAHELDGKSVLEISTYPADFAKRITEKSATFQQYASSNNKYFKIHVRDKSKRIGSNDLVESILIHSFSYRLNNDPIVVLLTDYPRNFWMQGNPRYEQRILPPILYLPDSTVTVEIDFTLNGRRYRFKGDMPAEENSTTLPTVIVNQSV